MKPTKSIIGGAFVSYDWHDSLGEAFEFKQWPLYEEWLPTSWPAPNYRSKVTPKVGILNPAFKYTPSTHTSVRETWRKFGWTERAAPQVAMADENPKRPQDGCEETMDAPAVAAPGVAK